MVLLLYSAFFLFYRVYADILISMLTVVTSLYHQRVNAIGFVFVCDSFCFVLLLFPFVYRYCYLIATSLLAGDLTDLHLTTVRFHFDFKSI